jgi:flavin-dependent dehydrogenase
MYNAGKGLLVLMIPIDTRKYIVATYMRPERHKSDKRVEDSYIETLQNVPDVWARLKDAKHVTPVVGVKGIRNGYRQPAGAGWALVGDAFHYKDPLDGQGIYDALLEAKYLAEAVQQWQSGGKTWEQAGQDYTRQAIQATRPMMLQTVKRVKSEVFTDPPPFVIKTVGRWMLNSPDYQRAFMRLLTRTVDPAQWLTPGVMLRAVSRGIMNDLFRRKSTAPPIST